MKKSTEPVINFYEKLKLVKEVNGEDKIESIYSKIDQFLSVIEGWLCIITPYKYAFKHIPKTMARIAGINIPQINCKHWSDLHPRYWITFVKTDL